MTKIKKRYATLVLCLAVGFLSTTAEAHPEDYVEKFPNCDALCQLRCDIDMLTPDVVRYCKRINSKPSVTENCYKFTWTDRKKNRDLIQEQTECLKTGNEEATTQK